MARRAGSSQWPLVVVIAIAIAISVALVTIFVFSGGKNCSCARRNPTDRFCVRKVKVRADGVVEQHWLRQRQPSGQAQGAHGDWI